MGEDSTQVGVAEDDLETTSPAAGCAVSAVPGKGKESGRAYLASHNGHSEEPIPLNIQRQLQMQSEAIASLEFSRDDAGYGKGESG